VGAQLGYRCIMHTQLKSKTKDGEFMQMLQQMGAHQSSSL
jgi:hypothetical protein